jgi:Fic-DOC domain mobile mystery protein B
VGLVLEYLDGQTPIDEDERQDLLVPAITTRAELNEFEQLNILAAMEWTLSRSFAASEVLSEHFVRTLHARMYGGVWHWAGKFRRSNKNIGVDKREIGVALRTLIDDCRYWIGNGTYDRDEVAVRFKHRLVAIHCFVNGNGRHARLMSDMLVSRVLGGPVFTWGGRSLADEGAAREAYLGALRAADAGSIGPLLAFARS